LEKGQVNKKDIDPCNRVKEVVCAKEGENILLVQRRKETP